MKILIVDDHNLFREGMCHILSSMDKEVTILEASNCDSAMQYASSHPDLDLILLDLNLSGKDGFTALSELSEKYPALPVVILSASNQRSDMQRALDLGAMGYIPKETSSAIMLNALQIIMSGGIYVPSNMAQLNNISESDKLSTHFNLTPRQTEVLALLVDGSSNKRIAQELSLTESTVKVHITSIFKAMNVTNRTQAAMAAERHQLNVVKR